MNFLQSFLNQTLDYFVYNRVYGNNQLPTECDLERVRARAILEGTIADVLPYLTNLTTLDLFHNNIGAEGARAIIEVLPYTTITNFPLYELSLEDSQKISRILTRNIELESAIENLNEFLESLFKQEEQRPKISITQDDLEEILEKKYYLKGYIQELARQLKYGSDWEAFFKNAVTLKDFPTQLKKFLSERIIELEYLDKHFEDYASYILQHLVNEGILSRNVLPEGAIDLNAFDYYTIFQSVDVQEFFERCFGSDIVEVLWERGPILSHLEALYTYITEDTFINSPYSPWHDSDIQNGGFNELPPIEEILNEIESSQVIHDVQHPITCILNEILLHYGYNTEVTLIRSENNSLLNIPYLHHEVMHDVLNVFTMTGITYGITNINLIGFDPRYQEDIINALSFFVELRNVYINDAYFEYDAMQYTRWNLAHANIAMSYFQLDSGERHEGNPAAEAVFEYESNSLDSW
jgi:hypothetical protein